MRLSVTEGAAVALLLALTLAADTGFTADTRAAPKAYCVTPPSNANSDMYCELPSGGDGRDGATCACRSPTGTPMMGKVKIFPDGAVPPGPRRPHYTKIKWD